MLSLTFSYADDTGSNPIDLDDEDLLEIDFEQRRVERLKRIRIDLITLNSKINKVKESLDSELDMMSKIQAQNNLRQLSAEFEKKKFLFIETATNINLSVATKAKKKADIMDDIKQILEPALNSIKQISERPKQIQDLQEKTQFVESRYQGAIEARDKLEKLFKEGKEKILHPKYKSSIKTLDKLIVKLKIELDDLQYKLLKSEKNEKSIVSTFSGLIFEFFKTKGKNLLLAFLVFITFFWLFKTGRNRFLALVMYKVNRSENKEIYQWMIRPVRVIYSSISTLMAFFFAILTLYVLNDWVLVTLILFVLAALIWSSKHYLPLFLEQSKIVLNLGAIREDERVVYNGLPWLITSLGYYCKLSNPVLKGGELRVNAKELINLNSRRVNKGEPWFPTKKGDWVELGDIFAQVILQTPEQVILERIGGERKFYKTADFYDQAPVNLSLGFAVDITFGVDYAHQDILFDELIPNLTNDLKMELYNQHADLKESFIEMSLDFVNANASSLDLKFFLPCHGDIASKKKMLTRSVQSLLVKSCTKYEYIIPFNQLTIHSVGQS